MKVKELLDSELKWTTIFYAKDKNGDFVGADSPEACRWCLEGAITKCYPLDKIEIIKKIYSHLEKNNIMSSIVEFNDEIATFDDIKNLVEALDI